MEVLVNYCPGLYSTDAPQREREKGGGGDRAREGERAYKYLQYYPSSSNNHDGKTSITM